LFSVGAYMKIVPIQSRLSACPARDLRVSEWL
jgi:hypothetical protein